MGGWQGGNKANLSLSLSWGWVELSWVEAELGKNKKRKKMTELVSPNVADSRCLNATLTLMLILLPVNRPTATDCNEDPCSNTMSQNIKQCWDCSLFKVGCFFKFFKIQFVCCFITQLVKKLQQWSLYEVIHMFISAQNYENL